MPSPVAESPAREAAESMPEPTGPSKLSGPPIAATPEPTATASSSTPDQPPEVSPKGAPASLVQPTPEPAPAAALADAVPVSIPEPSLRHEPIPVKSADAALYMSHSPESLSRRQSEDSGSTRSHGQVVPHEQRLPTEIHAAPWDSGPVVAERSSHPEQAPLATEAPPVRVDNVSNAATTISLAEPLTLD